jgi:short-subunit dehydrogenase
MEKLSGKTVIVTGSSSGLGRELAYMLLKEGAQVMINGRNPEKLMETRQHLASGGGRVLAVSGDDTQPEDCRNMVDECIREFGGIDILINNVGTGSNGLFRDTIPEAVNKVLATNIFGSIYPTYYALPYLLESRGSIFFISSLAGIHGLPFNFSYSMSKMALTSLAQSLRIELNGTGVHTGIVYVGFLHNGPGKRVISGNGTLVPATKRPDRFTMTMGTAGEHIIRAIRKRKAVTVLSFLGKFLFQANRISPSFVRKVLNLSTTRMKYGYTPAF